MTNTAQALYGFWSGFGLPAYTTNTVPDDAVVPYITYSLVETEPLEPRTHYAQVWYRSTSNAELSAKVDQILAAFSGKGVVRLPCTGGCVVLRAPTVETQNDENPENKYAYINMQINCYHN